MSKKVENQDLFSGDVFLKTVADVELLLVGLNEENLQTIRDEHQRYFQEEIAKI